MTEREIVANAAASVEEIQQGWHELRSRVGQLEAEKTRLEQENKSLKVLLERVLDHRLKSHSELVLILTALVSKLPLNDLGGIIAKLVEHNTNTSQFLSALAKGTTDMVAPQPVVLKELDQTKRDLVAAIKPVIEELIQSGSPLEKEMLQSLTEQPDTFFTPRVVRANRCFVKGYLPRERVVKEFGEQALVFFNDMTTDPNRNPNPKQEEIALGFKNDFETLFEQNPTLIPDKRQDLSELFKKVQVSKAPCDQSRTQKLAFHRLTFLVELLHYYEHQNTEAPDAIFAMRLPGLTEQLVMGGGQEVLDEKLVAMAESLLAYVACQDHRLMIINNVGKTGGLGKTLRFVLRLRAERVPDNDPEHIMSDFIKLLIPAKKAPPAAGVAAVLKLLDVDTQRVVVKAIMRCERIRREEAEALARDVANMLGLKGLIEEVKAQASIPPELERQNAWSKIKEMLLNRVDPAAIAGAMRNRLNAKYDADEIRQSWITLTEADPMSLIKVVCQLPYLPSGKTDPIAKPVLETYITRLTHEKYAAVYQKVVNSLKNMFKAKPDSPTLMNFLALVRWACPEAADKLCADIGMAVPA